MATGRSRPRSNAALALYLLFGISSIGLLPVAYTMFSGQQEVGLRLASRVYTTATARIGSLWARILVADALQRLQLVLRVVLSCFCQPCNAGSCVSDLME